MTVVVPMSTASPNGFGGVIARSRRRGRSARIGLLQDDPRFPGRLAQDRPQPTQDGDGNAREGMPCVGEAGQKARLIVPVVFESRFRQRQLEDAQALHGGRVVQPAGPSARGSHSVGHENPLEPFLRWNVDRQVAFDDGLARQGEAGVEVLGGQTQS